MAISTLKLTTEMKAGFRTEVACGKPFVIDQPNPMGSNEGPNPLEVFLSALGGCICAIGRIIANQEKLDVRGIRVAISTRISCWEPPPKGARASRRSGPGSKWMRT
ncbi:MAG TPA: OsmC family protein [Holophaga sp.]|nr:OsmC family protein [Holophaga sp.]